MYGGTASEMARLINDSKVLGENITITAEELTNVSFDKIIEAIHVVQTEMGITETTAKEAATTISGSVTSMKAAWQNLLTGLADGNQNIESLMDNFVSSVEITARNILPVLETTMQGIGELVEGLAPILSEAIVSFTTDVLPSLVETGASMVDSIIEGIAGNLGNIHPALEPLGESIINLKDSFVTVFNTIKNNVDWNGVVTIVSNIGSKVGDVVGKVAELATSFVNAATTSGTPLNNIAESVAGIASNGIDFVLESLDGLISLLSGDWNGAWEALKSAGESACETVYSSLQGILGTIESVAQELGALDSDAERAGAFGEKQTSTLPIDKDGNLILGEAGFSENAYIGENISSGVAEGIIKKSGAVSVALTDTANSAIASLKGNLKINSPSEVMRDEVGKWMSLGIASGIDDSTDDVTNAMRDQTSKAIESAKDSLGIHSPSTVFAEIGSYMVEGLEQGWVENFYNFMAQTDDGIQSLIQVYEQVPKQIDQVVNAVSTITYDPDVDYAAKMQETTDAQEFLLLAAQRNAKIAGENIDLAAKGYAENSTLLSQFTQAAGVSINDMAAQMESASEDMTSSATNMSTNVIAQIMNMVAQAQLLGQQFVSGLISGIESKASDLYETVKNLASEAAQAVRDEMQIASPSKVFAEIGGYMAEGLGVGYSEEFESAKSEILGNVYNLKENSTNAFEKSDTNATIPESNIESVQTENATTIVDFLRDILSEIQALRENMGRDFEDAVEKFSFRVNNREVGRLVRAVNT